MSKLLKQHQKKNERYKSKSFILHEPTGYQRQELTDMYIENSKVENNDELVVEFGLKSIRYIIRELTNVGNEIEEISDKELENLLDNGDREVQLLMREIEVLLHEIADDVLYQTTRSMRLMGDMLNTLEVNGDTEKLKKKWNQFNKKYKINVSWDDLINNASKREELENGLKEVK